MKRDEIITVEESFQPQNPLVALVGQPNSGKDTLFNALAGYKSHVGTLSDSRSEFHESEVVVGLTRVRLRQLPSLYSLTPEDKGELAVRNFLLSKEADAIIVVTDASVFSRSLELVLELIETGLPIVVALNMMDEARRKGVEIDVSALSHNLGVPVIPTVGTQGHGLVELARTALMTTQRPQKAIKPVYDKDVEEMIDRLVGAMPSSLSVFLGLEPRFLAIRMLEGDESIEQMVAERAEAFAHLASDCRRELADLHDWPEESVFASHRHAVAIDLFEKVAKVVSRRRRTWREGLDDIAMHPVWGLGIAVIVLGLLFMTSFIVGDLLGGIVMIPFEYLDGRLEPYEHGSIWGAMLKGLVMGVSGGAGIVLPYLVPLLYLLTFIEDLGFLPRMAFLLDGLFHRIGLHGKSVIPLILGYGCNVPAMVAVRNLETRRDRIITGILVPFIPCRARTVVILALVGAYLGPLWALGIYALNLILTAIVGRMISAIVPGRAAGLLMEVPPYRLPTFSMVNTKVWLRIFEFLTVAWPVLIVAAIVMTALEYIGIGGFINGLLSPVVSGVMGLPPVVGISLLFGILGKEMALVLLFAALGTTEVADVMSQGQILSFTLFITFWIPCIATLAVQVREIGWKWAGIGATLNTVIAILLAGMAVLLF